MRKVKFFWMCEANRIIKAFKLIGPLQETSHCTGYPLNDGLSDSFVLFESINVSLHDIFQ